MEKLPKFDGSQIPEEWVNDLQFYCHLNGITSEPEIVTLGLLRISTTFEVPSYKPNTFKSLISHLKRVNSLNTSVIKLSVRNELQNLQYNPNEDIIQFGTKIKSLFRHGEIYDHNIQKNFLLRMLPDSISRAEFNKKFDENSNNIRDQMVYLFQVVVLNLKGSIKWGNKIALKHYKTGLYLSCSNEKFDTYPEQNKMFAENRERSNRSHDNNIWIILPGYNQNGHKRGHPISYGSNPILNLMHYATKARLHSHNFNRTKCGEREVTGFVYNDTNDDWILSNIYDEEYLKDGHPILLLHGNLNKDPLCCHEVGGYDEVMTQEVCCHNSPSKEENMWIVELIE